MKRGTMVAHSNRFPLDEDYWDQETSGCDEVGRGCLAGPVVTACVTWVPGLTALDPMYGLLRDSKQLTASIRSKLFLEILRLAERVRVAFIPPYLVDHLNVLRASMFGFELTAPAHREDSFLFVDGPHVPANLKWARPVIKGENKVSAIAAASVIAKVVRDEWMQSAAVRFPGYGFEKHVGYGTAFHRAQFECLGPCALHRKSFKPISSVPFMGSKNQEWIDHVLKTTRLASLAQLEEQYMNSYSEYDNTQNSRIANHFQKFLYNKS